MQVTCPHCSKAFQAERAGTQYCPNCGNQLDVPEFGGPQVPQTPGWAPQTSVVSSDEPPANSPPWERRQQLGVFQAFWQTWKQSMLSPQTFWPTVDPQGSASEALWYAWIIHGIAAALALPLTFLGGAGSMSSFMDQISSKPGVTPEQLKMFQTILQAGSSLGVVATVVGILAIPIFLAITAAIIHVCGLIVGAASQGFTATFRAVCYSSGPYFFRFIPCVSFFTSIYGYVLLGMGLKTLHRTTTGKVAFALLLPVILLCGCCCIVGMMGGIAAALGSHAH